MNCYQNGKIYKLVNSVDNEIYVGSTCNLLSVRKQKHKSMAKIRPKQLIYSHLNIVGWDNIDIVLVEPFPCANKLELETRERYWIEQLGAKLNKAIPTRSQKEGMQAYRLKHRDELRANEKKRRERNPEQYKAQQQRAKEARITCTICGITYRQSARKAHERSRQHTKKMA